MRRPDDQTIVIFGASGDLTARKLVPALYALHRQKLLPERYKIVGYARSPFTEAQFRRKMRTATRTFAPDTFREQSWNSFAKHLNYVTGEFADTGAMANLESELAERDAPRRRLFYCATPPSAYEQIVQRLGEEGLAEDGRIVIEKPFGRDLASARTLNALVHEVFRERQIFRIDHYLGKETVQNILVFRFANGMFEPTWNRRYVTRVEITVAEELGIEGRGKFYEEAGALRDIVQNHVLQVLTFLAMEPPVSFDPESSRNEKMKVLSAIRPLRPEDVVRGQYAAGRIGRKRVPGYREEPGVAKRSRVETYAALRLSIDNWRWAGVPFYARTGKRLPRRVTEVTMAFHDAPHALFRDSRPETNHLTLRIQPDEGICLSFDAKVPGPEMEVAPVEMDFSYADEFKVPPAEAYERLLHDAMIGDHTLFPRADEVERSWTILEPILRSPPPVYSYPAGTWGPAQANALVDKGRWHLR